MPVVERIAKAVCETLARPADEVPPLVLRENKKTDAVIVLAPKKHTRYTLPKKLIQVNRGLSARTAVAAVS
jgi:hypothetical protein